jgi:serine/threonine protein kinase
MFIFVEICFVMFISDKIERELGEGSFGVVYAVKNMNSLQMKAMKVMKRTEETIALESELKVALGISTGCKYLVPVKEFFKESGHYCLIMELCKSDLESLLAKFKKFSQPVFFFFKYSPIFVCCLGVI